MLAAARMSNASIGHAIGCDEKTVVKYFSDELTFGAAKKAAEIVAAMFEAAKGGNVSAQKFLLARYAAQSLTPDGEPKPENVGKKELQEIEAKRPPDGEWGELVKH
jgi:hypothetical protein